MITMVTVFGTTFEFFRAPTFIQYATRLLVAKWGADLDAGAPVAMRVRAFQMMRKWGTPGTPI